MRARGKEKTILRGPLRYKMYEYIQFKKALGFTPRNTLYVFREFDDHVASQYGRVKFITREMVISYLATTSHLHSTSRGYRVTLLRGFCRYRYQEDPRNYIPEPRLLPYGKHLVKPHIFSTDEINRIIRKLKRGPKRKISVHTNVAVVALLATTGLRSGETQRLNLGDVDLRNGMLTIQRSKFFKTRLVPISHSTRKALIKYKLKRLGYFPTTDPSAPFFVNVVGRKLCENRVGRAFRWAVRTLKIKTSVGGWPRLHDLRHTFATRCLEQAYRSGKDPEAQLPVLATYLGHVNLKHTQIYLHPSLELLRKAGDRFYHYSHSFRNGSH